MAVPLRVETDCDNYVNTTLGFEDMNASNNLQRNPEGNAYFLATDDGMPMKKLEWLGRVLASEESPCHKSSKASVPPTNSSYSTCQFFVNDLKFQMALIFLIAIDCVIMGIDTFDFVAENPEIEETLDMADLVFLILFTIELGMQFVCHGLKLFLDGWLLIDFFIILMSWILRWSHSQFGETDFVSMQIFRAFRILRAARLITRVKSLRKLVSAFLIIIPRMVSTGALLLLVFYIFAVMFTSMFKNMYRYGLTSDDYFSRIDITFFTLFQFMTMDGWSTISREVMETHAWAWAPIIIFVIISSFIVVNIFLAMIHDTLSNLSNEPGYILTPISREWGAAQTPRSSTMKMENENAKRHSFNDHGVDYSSGMRDMQAKMYGLSCQVKDVAHSLEHMQQSIDNLSMKLQELQSTLSAPTDVS